MAGRGCLITVQILSDQEGGGSTMEERTLPVALHSPLEVLKEQLQGISGIPAPQQVLILLDLSDPDRNSDRVIDHPGHCSLRDIGVRNNSVLSLHSLGIVGKRVARAGGECSGREEVVYTLNTLIPPNRADHCFNGVIFNISAKGPYEVVVRSIWIGGMLGRVKILARDRPWEEKFPDEQVSNGCHWWAYSEKVSRRGWAIVASRDCAPSWDKASEIELNPPVVILPYQRRGFYCHSELPDDLGVQYNTYSKDAVVCEDEHICVTAGLGHAGNRLFDDVNGWYRAYRGPCGAFSYTSCAKGWDIWNHKIFPPVFKSAAYTLISAPYQRRHWNRLITLPHFLIYHILEVSQLLAYVQFPIKAS